MLSWSSSANLKVIGAEGHSPESLRNEVNRGAKFVIYSYNFSLIVMSFKRPSNIHFVKPGESRVLKGLPFTLISLVFGWWGIPWGIIYTFQSLHQNLTGGKDVTEDLIGSIAPTPEEQAAAAAGTPPPARPPAKQVSGKQVLLLLGGLAALFAIIYPIVCFSMGQNLRVAIVSGLATPYSVELNGTSYKLTANHPAIVSLAEGDFVLRGAPGAKGEERFTAHTDFFSRPFDRHVLIINPDRTAVTYRETTRYHPTGTTPDPNEKNSYDFYANRLAHYLPEPDHFFEDFPEHISMPSGTSVVSKTRLAVLNDSALGERAGLIREKIGYDALRDFLTTETRLQPENEELQRYIAGLLKPADARALFESHLTDRPVLIEWHRAYQYLMDRNFSAVDLLAPYRKWMDADPDDGSLTYLYARLLTDSAASHPLYERALHAKRPSAYAAYALGTDAFADGHFAEGLDLLQQAERAGLHSDSLALRKRDTLLALGRTSEVLADVRQRRAKNETDAQLFADELLLTQSQSPDRAAGQRAIASFIAALTKRYGKSNYQSVENYLNARLAYALGDERVSADLSGKLAGPVNAFEAAIGRRDHAAAAKAMSTNEQVRDRDSWLLVIAAHAAGDTAAAEKYFQQAVDRLAQADRYSRVIAGHITAGAPADHAELLRTPHFADELRALYTALGVHFPAQREAYFARARDLDHDPAFPHLLLATVRKDTPPQKSL